MSTKSVNDLLNIGSAGLKRYHGTASADAIIPAGSRIVKIILTPAAAACTALIYNAATATGTDLITLQVAANGSSFIADLGPAGTVYNVGTSTTLTGTGVLLDILYVTD